MSVNEFWIDTKNVKYLRKQEPKRAQLTHITPISGMLCINKKTNANVLQKNVKNPPVSDSGTGYANSATYSKNTGVNVKTKQDPKIEEIHTPT